MSLIKFDELKGDGIVTHIKAGENPYFAKAGLHSVKAVKKFKMALLLTLG